MSRRDPLLVERRSRGVPAGEEVSFTLTRTRGRNIEGEAGGLLTSAASCTSCVIVRRPSASVAGGSPVVAYAHVRWDVSPKY